MVVAVPSGLIIPRERATHGPRRAIRLKVIRLNTELRVMDRHLHDNLHQVVTPHRKLRWGEDRVKEGGA